MNKNKNLIFIIPDLDIGGAQRILIFLVNFLIKKKFNIKIILLKKKKQISFKLSKKVKVKSLNLYKPSLNIFQKIFYNLYRIIKIREEIKNYNSYKIISFLSTTNVLTLIAAIGLNKKIIVNERNDPSKQQLSVVWKFLRLIFYRYADKIITNLPHIKNNFFYKKSYFIPNPIILFSPKEKKINKRKIILTVARLNYQKNIDLLIKSFSKSLAIKKNWRLIIVGKGDDKNRLIKLTNDLNIKKFVNFKGIIEKIDFWYKKTEIFILPSRYEGMPNALIEAMNYKKAIIASDIPGIKYFIKNNVNGILFKVNDEKRLTNNINLLITNKKLRKILGNKAYKDVNRIANPKIFLNSWLKYLK